MRLHICIVICVFASSCEYAIFLWLNSAKFGKKRKTERYAKMQDFHLGRRRALGKAVICLYNSIGFDIKNKVSLVLLYVKKEKN